MAVSFRSLADLPGVKAALALSGGILLADALPHTCHLAPAAGLALLSAWLAVWIAGRRRGRRHEALSGLLLMGLLAAAGCAWAGCSLADVDVTLLALADTREQHELTVVVTDEPRRMPTSMAFDARVLMLHGDRDTLLQARTVVRYSTSTYDAGDTLADVQVGDTLRITASIRTPRPAVNLHGFDHRRWLELQGVTATLAVHTGGGLRITGRPSGPAPIRAALLAVRRHVRLAIRTHFRGERADVMAGLLLGERGGIDDETNEDFRNAGVYHILSVSGSHVAVVLMALWLALGRMRRSAKTWVVLPLLVFYSALTGGDAPVVRSVVMAALLLAGTVWQRITNPVNGLAVAAIVILIMHPLALFDIGFQLSFAAVFALLVFHPVVTAWLGRVLPRVSGHPVAGRIVSLLAMTFVAQAGTTPLIMAVFGQFSIASFVANLVVVPLVSLVIAASLPALLTFGLGSWPSSAFAAVADAALAGAMQASAVFARLPLAVVSTGVWPAWAAIGFTGLWFFVFHSAARIRQRAVIAVLAAAAVLAPMAIHAVRVDPGLVVTAVDVGQGDCILIETPGGRRLLVDAGPGGRSGDAGRKVIVPWLRARGITSLDVLVITHPDDDHLGGAASLLSLVRVGAVWRSGAWPCTPATRAFDSLLAAQSVPATSLVAGATPPVDSLLRIHVLWPDSTEATAPASNATSLVLWLVHGSCSILLMGDAEAEAERAIVERHGAWLAGSLIKLGHHGSRTSSTPGLLSAVHPSQVVITCGRLNRFRHPHRDVLRRLTTARVFRTDLDGAVRCSSDGRGITVHTMLAGAAAD